ncbi:four helix bundle protein [Candidatus Kaiserbacteria bacterium]|nr:four helix bundle protein [Candidatus Kaiserbacteria bacterium]
MQNENPLKPRLIQFSVAIMRLAHKHAPDKVLYHVFNQVIRSSGSVGANITEAHGAVTKAGFVRYFHIALQSANETKYWLEVIAEYGIQESEEVKRLLNESDELIRILLASLKTMKVRA